MKTIRILIIAAFLSGGFFLAGCDDNFSIANFPHKPHIAQDVACDICHDLNDNGVGYPTFETCLTCHEEKADVFNRCNECHVKQNITVKKESIDSHKKTFEPHIPAAWKEINFQHKKYSKNEPQFCLGCHPNIKTSERSSLKNFPAMEESMQFAKKQGISNDCQVCHTQVNKITPPASHNIAWKRKHGLMEPFMDKSRCLLCHQEETCTACHQTEKPQSHTNLWRKKTHGIQSSFDRSKCMVCHRSDECQSCHTASAAPIPPASYHNPDAPCAGCHAPQGAKRPANRFLKMMPHRMMMGQSSAQCLTCHSF